MLSVDSLLTLQLRFLDVRFMKAVNCTKVMGRNIEGVRGDLARESLKVIFVPEREKTYEVMAYLKVLDHFVTLVKCVLNVTCRPASLTRSLRVPSSQESKMPG